MNYLLSRLSRASDACAILGGWVIILFAFAISLEIFLRKIAGISLQGLDEYGGYMLALTSSFGFSYALVNRAHIRVDILVRMVSHRMQSLLHIFSAVTLSFFACMICYSAILLVISSWRLSARAVSPLQTPLILPQGLWAIGLVFFAFTSVIVTVLAIRHALHRNWAKVNQIAGAYSASEETEDELKSARERGLN